MGPVYSVYLFKPSGSWISPSHNSPLLYQPLMALASARLFIYIVEQNI